MADVRPVSRAPVAFAVATLGIAVFAIMDAVMKGLTLDIGVYNAMLWRSLAGAVIAGVPWLVGRGSRPSASLLRLHVQRGVVSTAMALLFFWGLARVPMAQAVALTFISPLIAMGLAVWLLGERVDRRAITASLIAFAGVLVILVGQARAALGQDALLGALAVLASALCYAYNIILMRRQAQLASPIEVGLFQNLIVFLLLALAAPLFAEVPPARALVPLLIAACLATASLLLLSWAYARAPASYLAPVEYTAFVWASILGYLVFGEAVGLFTLVGAAMIAGGCLMAARRRIAPLAGPELA